MTVRAGRTGAFVVPDPGTAERDARLALLDRVRERLGSVPNVESVTYSRRMPGPYFLATTAVERAGLPEACAVVRAPRGRRLHPHAPPHAGHGAGDRRNRSARRQSRRRRAIANWLATCGPTDRPIGQTLLVGEHREPHEIVGVVPDALYDGPVHDPHPRYVFVAEQQFLGSPAIDPTFYIRHRGTLEAIAPLVGRAIAEVDADLPIVSMATMVQRLDSVTVLERQVSTLLVVFALISLLVATLGHYAVAMFNMRRRTRDFGVRMALGASASLIQRVVIGEALRLTLAGLAIGFVLSLVVGMAARRVLFGVTPTDPVTYAGVFALLAVASILAAYLPAWRAGRVNVVDALRQE